MSLFDSSTKGVKFAEPGATITGTVTGEPFERQQTKFGTTEYDFWPNGDPKMQIIIPLKTMLREDVDDDGERTLYVASGKMRKAISAAIKIARVADVAVGGTLTVTYTGPDPESKNPANPAKLYTASYTPPTRVATDQAVVPEGAVAPVAAAQPQAVPTQALAPQMVTAPAPQAPPPPAQATQAAVPTPPTPVTQSGIAPEVEAQVAQLRAAGIADAVIGAATGLSPAQLADVPF